MLSRLPLLYKSLMSLCKGEVKEYKMQIVFGHTRLGKMQPEAIEMSVQLTLQLIIFLKATLNQQLKDNR